MAVVLHHHVLTGSGTELWVADYNIDRVRIHVNDIGEGQALDLVDPSRYLRLGWWAMIENFVSDATYPDGLCFATKAFFIDNDYVHHHFTALEAASGFDGVTYQLGTDVEVEMWFIG